MLETLVLSGCQWDLVVHVSSNSALVLNLISYLYIGQKGLHGATGERGTPGFSGIEGKRGEAGDPGISGNPGKAELYKII